MGSDATKGRIASDKSASTGHETRHAARVRVRLTMLLAVLILIPSVWGFGSKFVEFVRIYRGDVDGAFAVAPILNYLLASAGFFLLLLWGIGGGMLADVEGPKQTMLENEARLDRGRGRRGEL